MPMKDNDIVFVLKDKLDTDELRYSLRSIEKNFPHRFVWFVGSMPEGFKPDRALPHKQTGVSKWDKIRSSMLYAVEQEELSDEFFWFNDDFFVMKPVKGKFVNYADKSLEELVAQLRTHNPWLNAYGRTVDKVMNELKAMKCTTVNFEVHMPMLFQKELVAGSIMRCSSPQMRSAYGNIHGIPWRQHDDVKVYDMNKVPEDPDYLSTNDNTFTQGEVGKYIRGVFDKPSRFEVPGYV